jgi:hypothetical protein
MRQSISFVSVILMICLSGCGFSKRFDQAARRPINPAKPLEGAWEGTLPARPPFVFGGWAKAILLGNQSLPPWCECRLGPDDYFVEMESGVYAFPFFIFGDIGGQNFVLRNMAVCNGKAILHGETVGPAGDESIYYVNAFADERGFTLSFVTPRLACTPIYKIHFTRAIVGPDGR